MSGGGFPGLYALLASESIPAPVVVGLDAVSHNQGSGSGTSIAASITTTKANDVIIAFPSTIQNPPAGISGISDTAGLTWTQRATLSNSATTGPQYLEEWWAYKPTAGSTTVTVTWASSRGNRSLQLAAYSGVNTNYPFDPNASVPAVNQNTASSSGSSTQVKSAAMTTTQSNDWLIAFACCENNVPTAGSNGEVQDDSTFGAGAISLQHLAVTGTASAKAVTWANNDFDWNVISDALTTQSFGGNDANTLLLLHCDGSNGSTTFTDSSSNGVTVTANGTAAVSTTASKFGGAAYKGDGTAGCKLTTNLTANPGSGDFTFEFWINTSTVSGNHYIQAKQHDTGSPAFGPFSILLQGTGIIWYVSSTGTSWDISGGNNGGTIATGAWHHFALVRHGSTFTAYLDGVANATTATSSASLYASSDAFSFGGPPDTGTSVSCFNGYLDEIRYSNVARWTANFTPPPTAYTS